jgi:hypothetical protein
MGRVLQPLALHIRRPPKEVLHRELQMGSGMGLLKELTSLPVGMPGLGEKGVPVTRDALLSLGLLPPMAAATCCQEPPFVCTVVLKPLRCMWLIQSFFCSPGSGQTKYSPEGISAGALECACFI